MDAQTPFIPHFLASNSRRSAITCRHKLCIGKNEHAADLAVFVPAERCIRKIVKYLIYHAKHEESFIVVTKNCENSSLLSAVIRLLVDIVKSAPRVDSAENVVGILGVPSGMFEVVRIPNLGIVLPRALVVALYCHHLRLSSVARPTWPKTAI